MIILLFVYIAVNNYNSLEQYDHLGQVQASIPDSGSFSGKAKKIMKHSENANTSMYLTLTLKTLPDFKASFQLTKAHDTMTLKKSN